ncbi:MAG: insulinase family protein, partial [Candidatus Hydrothermia bacterium]
EFIASYFSNYFYFQNVPELRALPDFGLIPDVLSLELNEIKDFYAGLLGKTRIRVVVVSNLDLQERIQDFEVLKDVRSAEFTLVNLRESYPKFDKIYFVDMDIEQAHIRVIAPSIPRSHPSYQHLKVANFIFGGSDLSSRLMKRLRVKEALTYSASSSINVGIPLNGNIVGAYKVIACETNKRNVRRAFDLIFDELSKVHEEGFSEEELQDAVSFFKGNTPLKMESYAQLLSMITEEVIYELPYFHFEEEVNEIKGIKIQELNDVALRFFNFDHPFILIVGKASTLKEYFTDLEAEFIDPMEYIKG